MGSFLELRLPFGEICSFILGFNIIYVGSWVKPVYSVLRFIGFLFSQSVSVTQYMVLSVRLSVCLSACSS